jgi:hypothetical protein
MWPVGDAGAVTLRCQGFRATIVGTAGADEIRATERRDVIVSLAGSDTIYAKGGDDIICAGPGADFLGGMGGDDQLLGGAGDDRIEDGNGDDTLWGGPGADDLLAWGGGRDRLFGGGGDDHLDDERGPLNGGPGDDRCFSYGPLTNCEPIRVGGMLLPGEYELVRFEPGFTFSVAERGWTVVWPDHPWLVTLEWYPAGLLTFHDVPAVVWEPDGGPLVEAPSDLFAWLAAHPCVQQREPAQPVAIGTASGLVAEFTGLCEEVRLWPQCSRQDGDCPVLGLGEGGSLWLVIITVGQVEFVVTRVTYGDEPVDRLEFEQAADDLWASVAFTPGRSRGVHQRFVAQTGGAETAAGLWRCTPVSAANCWMPSLESYSRHCAGRAPVR